MSSPFRLELEHCLGRHPTSDGRALQLAPAGITKVELDLRRLPDPTNDFPTDALACDVSLSDCDGRVWVGTSTVTAELFVRHLFDASQCGYMNLHRLDAAPAELLQVLETQMRVTGLRSSHDDRFHRQLIFRDPDNPDDIELVFVSFKYSSFHFDVAGDRYTLVVRVNADNPHGLTDQQTYDGVGPFVFRMQSHYLLQNNAILTENAWRENPFPQPLVFRLTERTATPQLHVTVVD